MVTIVGGSPGGIFRVSLKVGTPPISERTDENYREHEAGD